MDEIINSDTFKVLHESNSDYLDDLKTYVESYYPIEWLTFTHPDQEKFIIENYTSSVRLSLSLRFWKNKCTYKTSCKILKQEKIENINSNF